MKVSHFANVYEEVSSFIKYLHFYIDSIFCEYLMIYTQMFDIVEVLGSIGESLLLTFLMVSRVILFHRNIGCSLRICVLLRATNDHFRLLLFFFLVHGSLPSNVNDANNPELFLSRNQAS